MSLHVMKLWQQILKEIGNLIISLKLICFKIFSVMKNIDRFDSLSSSIETDLLLVKFMPRSESTWARIISQNLKGSDSRIINWMILQPYNKKYQKNLLHSYPS